MKKTARRGERDSSSFSRPYKGTFLVSSSPWMAQSPKRISPHYFLRYIPSQDSSGGNNMLRGEIPRSIIADLQGITVAGGACFANMPSRPGSAVSRPDRGVCHERNRVRGLLCGVHFGFICFLPTDRQPNRFICSLGVDPDSTARVTPVYRARSPRPFRAARQLKSTQPTSHTITALAQEISVNLETPTGSRFHSE